jgi:DNA-binding GntR family transcriptional regulator
VSDRGHTLYRRVYFAVLDGIVSGKLAPGSRLPSTRAMSRALGVSRNTVMQAFDQLHAEGYVEAKVGSGTCVTRGLPSTLRKRLGRSDRSLSNGPRIAGLIAQSGYPVDQKDLEDWDGNYIYLYDS